MSTLEQEPETQQITPAELAFRKLLCAVGLFRRSLDAYFNEIGISGAQWAILRTLERAKDEGDDHLRLTDLSERLYIRPASVTNVVNRLVRAGLVHRTTSQSDRRAHFVRLTEAGKELLAREHPNHAQRVRELLSALSTPEQQQLHDMLNRVCGHLKSCPSVEDREEVK